MTLVCSRLPALPRHKAWRLGHAGAFRSYTRRRRLFHCECAARNGDPPWVGAILPKLFAHGPAANIWLRLLNRSPLGSMNCTFVAAITTYGREQCDRFHRSLACSGSTAEELLVLMRRPITSQHRAHLQTGIKQGTAALMRLMPTVD